MQFKRILVPTDFSEDSLKALRSAVKLARHSGGHITLLNVGIPADVGLPPGAAPTLSPMFGEITKRVGKEVQHHLERMVQTEIPEGMSHDVQRASGFPPEVIVETAKDGGYDAIVISSHGHRGIKRALLGSVTDRVIRLAEVPVLVVR